MAATNMTPETSSEITRGIEVQNALLAKVAAIVETAKNHTQVCVLALTLAVAGAAHANEPIVLPSSELGTSSDAQGKITDSSLNSAQIQNQITITETSIAELEAKGMDNFSDDDWNKISLLQDELIELLRS
jgi:hypothetical protein